MLGCIIDFLMPEKEEVEVERLIRCEKVDSEKKTNKSDSFFFKNIVFCFPDILLVPTLFRRRHVLRCCKNAQNYFIRD